jgi:hypothetical protein
MIFWWGSSLGQPIGSSELFQEGGGRRPCRPCRPGRPPCGTGCGTGGANRSVSWGLSKKNRWSVGSGTAWQAWQSLKLSLGNAWKILEDLGSGSCSWQMHSEVEVVMEQWYTLIFILNYNDNLCRKWVPDTPSGHTWTSARQVRWISDIFWWSKP